MRLSLVLVVALGAFGCAKKPAAKAPAQTPAPDKTNQPGAPAGGEAPNDPNSENKDSGSIQSDPCDGGESKGK